MFLFIMLTLSFISGAVTLGATVYFTEIRDRPRAALVAAFGGSAVTFLFLVLAGASTVTI